MSTAASSSVTVCPFCNATVSSSDIDRHANNHFEDEALARDMELAHQLALAPPSPPSQKLNNQGNGDMSFRNSDIISLENMRLMYGGLSGNGLLHIDGSLNSLINVQIKSKFFKVQDGVIALLRHRLALENENSTCILSGYVDHFQSTELEDVGWGCGWRNIQMLSSHLLIQRQEARKALFGGSGFVPDIASLQRWLEIAWERGFDTIGSNQFNDKIYGSTNWIGTTECAALLRSFGFRARIVDFGPKEIESLFLSVPGSEPGAHGMNTCKRGKRNGIQVHGPMDRFLIRKDHNLLQAGPARDEKSSCSSILPQDDLDCTCSDNLVTRKIKGHQVLVDWIWNYFSDGRSVKSSNRVIVTEKAPLYFQHDGHSRTIVGIQAKHLRNGTQQYSLLILDPAHRTSALERSLKDNVGWQKLIKRGIHTLKKPQYQLCYIDPGIAYGEEANQLKTLDSVFFEI